MSVCSFVTTQSATSSQSPTSSSQSNPTQTICSGLNEKPILTLKTSPKQVLMLNSNRINLSPSHPPSNINTPESSLQYVVKKSPTILILSKPKTELSPRAVTKPTKSSSNLISSYFNKQNSSPPVAAHTAYNFLMPNSKPIPLIPIGKLTPNTNTSNFTDNFNGSQLIPIETIEISTATIEINSTDEQAQVAETVPPLAEPIKEVEIKVEEDSDEEDEEKVEEKMDEEMDLPKPNLASKSEMNKSDVTRCICQMDHDDGFMICCDNCLVWQHIACMEVNKKKIPDKFYCEKCVPRAVNAQRAKQLQEKYLKSVTKNTNKIKNRRNSSSNSSTPLALTPHQENEQIDPKNEPIDEPMPEEASILSPADSTDQNDAKNKLKRRYKSRTIREEFENKQIDENNLNEYSKNLLDKIPSLDLKSFNICLNNTEDLLKVIKIKSKKFDEVDDQKYRVKITQNVVKDQFIAEYVGNISSDDCVNPENYSVIVKIPTNSELKPCSSSSSSSSTTKLNDLETITVIIDSNKIYNNTRYIRKCCVANTRLVFVKDSNSNLRFYIQAIENITKNSEIFLPSDSLEFLKNTICVCESNECDLRLRLNANDKIIKTSPTKNTKKEFKVERRPSTHSPAPIAHTHTEDTTNISKNLSREDRKLASYMRVIEKLEKQGKRKNRETKPRDSSDKSTEKLLDKNNDNNAQEKENNDKVEKIEKVEKNSKKSKSNRPSLLIQQKEEKQKQQQHQQISEQIDQEITSITESNRQQSEVIKPTVKSPDYSFVNLNIEPRRTLNLLQRNLNDSDDENRYSPTLESLENNKIFLQKSFFHPKKHWLKTSCSNENTQIENESSPSKAETSSQPPKKRRIFIEDPETQPNEQLSIQPVQPVFVPLPEHQFYLNFMNLMPQMSSPNYNILNSAPLSSASNCSTPNFYNHSNFYSDPFAFHHMAAMSIHPNIIQPTAESGAESSIEPISEPNQQLVVNESNVETSKKKVSLAEYRQRKETVKPAEVLFESISSNKSSNNDDSLCELDVYPTNSINLKQEQEKTAKMRDSSSSSSSSRCSRKSSYSNISDISSCSSVRSRSPSNSSKRSHSSRLSSFEKQKENQSEKSNETKYFKFKYGHEDNLKRKLLDKMLDEYRNEGLKLKRKSRTRSCSLNRSMSESRSDSSFEENWRKRSDNKYFHTHYKRSNSLNRRLKRRLHDRLRASRSNEDNYLKYNYQKPPKFDLRYQLKNKSHFSKSYGSSSCSSSSSILSSNEISSMSSVVKKF